MSDDIGLERGTVKVSPYSPNWVKEFEAEKKRLIDMFGSRIIAVEHIGSTSIPGMPSKPIIDILVAVKSLDDAQAFIMPLQEMGYEYMPNRWFKDRYFFPKGPDSKRTHHLNLVEMSSETAWTNHLLFRDYLISHPKEKEKYIKLKQELASKYANDREKYTEAKSDFVRNIIDQAKS